MFKLKIIRLDKTNAFAFLPFVMGICVPLFFSACLRDFNNPIDPQLEKPIPPRPIEFTSEALPGEHNVFVSFEYDFTFALGLILERSEKKQGPFGIIDTIYPPATSYKDTLGLKDKTEYFYRLYAFNKNGNSKKSSPVAVTTLTEVIKDTAPPEILAFIKGIELGKEVVLSQSDVIISGKLLDATGIDSFAINGNSFPFSGTNGNWEYEMELSSYRTPMLFEAWDSSEGKWKSSKSTVLFYDYPNIPSLAKLDSTHGKLSLSWNVNNDLDFVNYLVWFLEGDALDTSSTPPQTVAADIQTLEMENFSPAKNYWAVVGLLDSLGNIVAGKNSYVKYSEGRIYRHNMVAVPAGEFLDGEGKLSKITQAYYMDSTEITQAMYQDIAGFNPAYYQNPENPVEGIHWVDAVKFANLRSKFEGLDTVYEYSALAENEFLDFKVNWDKNGYRLPTEDEWLMAARAGTSEFYFWGQDTAESVVKEYAWYEKNSQEFFDPLDPNSDPVWTEPHAVRSGPQQVAQKQPNPWGLYDILGNVEEWAYDPIPPFDADPPENREDGRVDYRGGSSYSRTRIFSGGSYLAGLTELKLGVRRINYNSFDLRQRQVGLRLVAKY